MSKRDVYVAKMKLQLDELNLKMRELEQQAQTASEEARMKYESAMGRLREQSALAGTQLDHVKSAAEDQWHQLVSEMEKLRAAFAHAFADFKAHV